MDHNEGDRIESGPHSLYQQMEILQWYIEQPVYSGVIKKSAAIIVTLHNW